MNHVYVAVKSLIMRVRLVCLDLALHLSILLWMSCSTYCQIMFYQWIAWHAFHMSCIKWTYFVF